jgi:tripartite-type tricarboxylate transporter receptor subunit TctC
MVRKPKFMRAVGTLAATIAMAAIGSAVVGDAHAAVDLKGKRIQLIVPFAEGGGSDIYARMMQPYFEKYLPGNPTILVMNKPGGGGTTGAVYFDQRAQKDGTWALTLSTSTAANYALGDPRAKFKLEEFIPVILSPRGITQYARNNLGLQDVKDLKGKIEKLRSYEPAKLGFGGKTPTSGDLALRIALSLLDVEVNSVWGLGGNGPMALGFERGEFTLNYDNTMAYLTGRKHMIESGLAVPIYTFGNYDENGKLTRDPALPDVPHFVEVYKAVYGKEPSGAGFEAWKAMMGVSVSMSKSLLLPAGTPKDVVEAWRNAARKMLKDPEYVAKAKDEAGPYPQIVGDAAVPIIKSSVSISPEAKAWIAKYVKVRYDVDLGSAKHD